MKSTRGAYRPVLVIMAVYGLLFGVGCGVDGTWQMVAMLAFYCALGQALNIFMGTTGYVNFGYVAFLGVGTYGMALALTRFPGAGRAAPVVGFALAVLFTTVLAVIVGAVALRLRGAYFAIATIGVNEGLRALIEGARIWNGSEGILFFGSMNKLFGREAASSLMTFWADTFVFILAVGSALATFAFMRCKLGYALTALREDEDAARVMGIDVTRSKMTAFIVSAAFAGLLGASAWALKLGYVYPADVFEIHYTVEAIIIVMLGGGGTVLGPLVGGLIYAAAKYLLAVHLPGFQLLVFAPIIILVIIVFPEGIVGFVKRKSRGTCLESWIL